MREYISHLCTYLYNANCKLEELREITAQLDESTKRDILNSDEVKIFKDNLNDIKAFLKRVPNEFKELDNFKEVFNNCNACLDLLKKL